MNRRQYSGWPAHINVVPALHVGGARVALVKHVQVAEPFPVQQDTVHVYVRVGASVVLHHGVAVPKIAGIPVAFLVGRGTGGPDVEVTAVGVPNGTTALLEVATPPVAFPVERCAVWPDMVPTGRRVCSGDPLVETEGADVAFVVGGVPVAGDVVGAAVVDHGGETGRVELQHRDEASLVCRTAKMNVMGAIGGHGVFTPIAGHGCRITG